MGQSVLHLKKKNVQINTIEKSYIVQGTSPLDIMKREFQILKSEQLQCLRIQCEDKI